MSIPELQDKSPVTDLLPLSQPTPSKKSFVRHYYKSALMLVAIYALIINQAQRNKKYASQNELPDVAGTKAGTPGPPSFAKENKDGFLQASFFLK